MEVSVAGLNPYSFSRCIVLFFIPGSPVLVAFIFVRTVTVVLRFGAPRGPGGACRAYGHEASKPRTLGLPRPAMERRMVMSDIYAVHE